MVDSSETNNVESPPDLPPKEVAEEGVPDSVSSSETEKNAISEKELSWEKIAAEIAADGDNETSEVSAGAEAEATEPKTDETVITTVTEEKTATDETHEVVADSTEQQTVIESEEADYVTDTKEAEPVVETTTENPEPEDALPVEEVAVPVEEVALPVDEETSDLDKSVGSIPVDEVIEETVTEVVEGGEPEEAATEVVEAPETEEIPETE